jgi:hypothetical protein
MQAATFFMSSEKEKDNQYLVCLRIVAGRNPPVISTRTRCSRCGGAVWRASTSPDPEGGASILCVECMLEIAEDSDITIMPPTKKQIESIRSVFKRANN